MARFKIKTNTSEGDDQPGEMLEFAHVKAATDDAQVALAEMARDKLPNGKHLDFGVQVEDETGKEIYRAALSFDAQTEEDIDRQAEAAARDVAWNLGFGKRE